MEIDFRVVDATGTPIAAALVGLGSYRDSSNEGSLRTVRTDAAGRAAFAFEQEPPNLTLYLAARGMQAQSASAKSFAALPRVLTMSPGTTFSGHVRDEAGRPLGDVEVDLVIEGPNWIGNGPGCGYGADHWPECRTDATGAFSFAWFDARWCNRSEASVGLRLTHRDHVPRVVSIDHLIHRPGNHELDVVLASGLSVGGRVLDHTGAAVGGATIDVRWHGRRRGRMSDYDHKRAITQSDGAFRVRGLNPGTTDLQVIARGSAVQRAKVDPARETSVVLRLQRGSSVEGVARTADGTPRARVSVRAVNLLRGIHHDVTADADGRFRVDGLPRRGRVFLRVGVDTNQLVRLPCPEVELRPLLVPLTVRVLDRQGQPVASAPVSIIGPCASTLLTTDADGRAAIDVPPGWYQLDTFVPGHGGRSRCLRLRPRRQSPTCVLHLPAGRTLHGCVVGPSGTPVAGCRVVATHWLRHLEQHEVTTGSDGRFVLTHLRGGYRIAFLAAGYAPRAIDKRISRVFPLAPRSTVRLEAAK